MMEIMRIESTYKGVPCNHVAIGDSNTPYESCGLLQVRTLPGRPSCDELMDPAFNVAYAYSIYKEQGMNAWYNSYNKLLAFSN